jgi:hypothetical protein
MNNGHGNVSLKAMHTHPPTQHAARHTKLARAHVFQAEIKCERRWVTEGKEALCESRTLALSRPVSAGSHRTLDYHVVYSRDKPQKRKVFLRHYNCKI